MVKVKIKLTDDLAKVPVYSTEGAAGCDIYSIEDVTIMPDEIVGMKWSNEEVTTLEDMQMVECSPLDPWVKKHVIKRHPVKVSTGLIMELPPETELELRGRSGLAFNYEIIPFNGTIDEDFRSTISVKIWNLGHEPYVIKAGDKIAQGVIKNIIRAEFEQVDELSDTVRGAGGFGHTGR